MQTLHSNYFSTYQNVMLTRGDKGVSVAEFSSNRGPFIVTRVHFVQPLKERLVREVGYGLSLEGAAAADLVKSMQPMSEPGARKGRVA